MSNLTDDPPEDDKPAKKNEPLPPVSESEVHDACDQINRDGEKPTYKMIRALLGRGSYTTMARFVQTWQPVEIAAVPPLPESVSKLGTSLMQAIWREAVQHGSTELLEERRRAKAEFDELREAIAEVEEREAAGEVELAEAVVKLNAMMGQRDRHAQEVVQWREKLLRAQGEIDSYKAVVERFAGDGDGDRTRQAAAE